MVEGVYEKIPFEELEQVSIPFYKWNMDFKSLLYDKFRIVNMKNDGIQWFYLIKKGYCIKDKINAQIHLDAIFEEFNPSFWIDYDFKKK